MNPPKQLKLELHKIMETQLKKNPKPKQLNPNWALLQQKLKPHGSIHSRTFTVPKSDASSNTVLGKRKERSDVESNHSQKKLLIPANDDFSLTDVVAMDCEMVGVDQGNKSALGRVTLVNKWGNVIYDEFVRPMERIVDFRTHVSGIRPSDLKKAKDFPTVQKRVAELIKGKILVGHALSNDLKALLLSHPKKDVRDTSEYSFYQKEGCKRALRHLAAEFLGVEIQNGEHCPVEDARSAMLLYQKKRKEWEKSVKSEMKLKLKQKKRKPRKKSKDGASTTAISRTKKPKYKFISQVAAATQRIPLSSAYGIMQQQFLELEPRRTSDLPFSDRMSYNSYQGCVDAETMFRRGSTSRMRDLEEDEVYVHGARASASDSNNIRDSADAYGYRAHDI